MKIYLFIFLALIAFQASPNEQYSAYRCNALKEEKQRIQDRFARGYGASEANYLNDRDRELFRIMRKHCVKPTPQPSYQVQSAPYESDQFNQLSSYNSAAINDNWSARNRVYQGEKLEAWEAFYKMPSRCRQRQPAQADFVFCAENKAEQRQAFEKHWKNRVNVSR